MVDGSNPSTPTTFLRSNSHISDDLLYDYVKFVNSFVNTFVYKINDEPDPCPKFAAELGSLQAKLGITDRTLAAILGISAPYLSFIKHDLRQVSQRLIRRMAENAKNLENSLPKSNKSAAVSTYIYGMDGESKYNIASLLGDFLRAKQVAGGSAATLRFYNENLKRFLWWQQQNGIPADVRGLDAAQLRAFLHYVQTTRNRWGIGSTSSRKLPSMSTVDAYWRSLQGFLAWLVSEDIIAPEANPLRKIPRPRCPRKVVQDIPLDLVKQALGLWDSHTLVGTRNAAIILMLLDTGMRLSECSGLALSAVNVEEGIVTVWGKGNKQRRVRLGEMAKQALLGYLQMRGSSGPPSLWLNKWGKPFRRSGIQIMVRRLSKLGGNVRWSPHTFRNTFALNYLRAGGDPFTLQLLGGWEDLEMPRHYSAALKIEDAFEVHKRASPADRLRQ